MSINVFEFDKKELSSPELFLGALQRLVDQAKTLRPFDLLDTGKFYNQATNMYHYEEDAWFDLVYSPEQFPKLEEFMKKVNALQAEVSEKVGRKNYTPLIIQSAAESRPHIDALMHHDPFAMVPRQSETSEHTVKIVHSEMDLR